MLMGIGIRLQAGARRQSRYHNDGEVSFSAEDDYAIIPLRVTGARRQPPFAIPKLENSGLPSLLRRLLLRLLPRAPRFYQLLALLFSC